MSYIVAENITKEVSRKVLFNKASFSVQEGEKIALVAQNGAGKSTLLKVLMGESELDSGEITTQNNISYSFLSQSPKLIENNTVEEEIFSSSSKLIRVVKAYEKALENTQDLVAFEKATEAMNKENAWEYESQINEMIEKLGLKDILDQKIENLSGGQKKRIALVKLLLDDAQLLLLDEPTNHLDIEMIEWLGSYLKEMQKTLLMVTHDRYFLDKVCNFILELDQGKMYKHEGNYSLYLKNKSIRHEHHNLEIDKTKAKMKRELEYIQKSPQGRQSRSGKRVEAYHDFKNNLGTKKETKLVELDVVSSRLGNKVLEFHSVSKRYQNKVILDAFDYSFNKGEKIGIIGENGAGKTTLLKLILGKENIDSGKIVQGESVTFGYYSQHQEELNPELSVIDTVKEIAGYIPLSNGKELSASKLLERFLFSPTEQQTKVKKLSGGERKRLSLLRVLMKNPNFLILDEPTNDFDLMTLEVLESFLRNFNGCVIIVSHDRFFMDQIIDHLFVFKGDGEIRVFPGNYSDYRNSIKNQSSSETNTKVSKENKDKTKSAASLYREISKLESRKEGLLKKMHALENDFDEIAVLNTKLKNLELEIEKKNEEWLELTI